MLLFFRDKNMTQKNGFYRNKFYLLQMKITGIDYCTDRYTDTNDVPLVMTLLFMPVRTAETFLSLYTKYPLSSSTYYGVDNGSPGLKV